MLDTSFTFDGKYAKALGIELEEPITLSAPVPKTSTVTIAGRNGDLHFFDGSYSNRTATAKCFLCSYSLPQQITEINARLLGSGEYRRLVLDDDTGHFLLARPMQGIGGRAVLGLLESFTLKFDCKPQRFLKYGDDELDLMTKKEVYNPTAFPAKPLIMLEGEGDFVLSVNYERVLTVYGLNGTLWYDAELDTAYSDGVNLNNIVSVDKALELPSGRVRIDVTGDRISAFTAFKIIPRWWEL